MAIPIPDPEIPESLDLSDAEEIIENDTEDHPMSDGEDENVELHNDSIAYFDGHSGPIFSISAHPKDPYLFLTGSGDDTAHIFSIRGSPEETTPRPCKDLKQLEKHDDSVAATTFTFDGEYAVTCGLDGGIKVYASSTGWKKSDAVREVEEIVWISAHPTEAAFAVGAAEGSVWIYDIEDGSLRIRHVCYSHTASCTAGVFSATGGLLATVSEDGSFVAWDTATGQPAVAVTAADARFAIEGGLYSVAVSPSGAVAAVGGATGDIRIVGLPNARSSAQAGHILAAIQAHTESVESLSFHPSVPLLASGGVDGNIVLYDAARGYAVRKTLEGHVDAVVKVEFVTGLTSAEGWVLTSCGIDGTVRRWDARVGVETACLRGHLGGNGEEGEGGVLGFVQTKDRIVTAGDDNVALVFELAEGPATGKVEGPTVSR